jgi:hypothetical protein
LRAKKEIKANNQPTVPLFVDHIMVAKITPKKRNSSLSGSLPKRSRGDPQGGPRDSSSGGGSYRRGGGTGRDQRRTY